MSAHDSPKWFPSETRVSSESYTWRLSKSQLENFTYYEDEHGNRTRRLSSGDDSIYGMMGLQSSEFTLSFVNSSGKTKKLNLHLWLMRLYKITHQAGQRDEQLSAWVELILTDLNKPPWSRHCTAALSGKISQDSRNTFCLDSC